MSYRIIERASINVENTYPSFEFLGYEFSIEEFQGFTSPWGDYRELGEQCKELGFGDGFAPRGGGNSDTAVYAIDLTDFHNEDVVHIALIDLSVD